MSSDQRVAELNERFDGTGLDLAALLCDGHPQDDIAFTIIQPDLTAVDLTYGALCEASIDAARQLTALGVGKGDRVATLMGKSVDLVVALMAIWRLGAVHVPLFTAFAPPAIALRLAGSDAKVVLTDESQAVKLEPGEHFPADRPWQVLTPAELRSVDGVDFAPVTVSGDDELIRLFTSGTTGTPKGVPIPVRAIGSIVTYLEYGLHVTEDDVYWDAADPGWAYGLFYGIVAPLAAGRRSLLLQAGFTPQLTWDVLSTFGVTNFAAAPTVYRSLRSGGVTPPKDLKIRRATSAGEPLNPEVVTWAEQTLGLPIHDTYGQTELGMCVVNGWHPEIAAAVKPGSMGRPMPGWQMAVLTNDSDEPAAPGELGRVAVDVPASPGMWFTGYVDAPEKTAERFSADGRWYYTGDAGSIDDDGYIFFSSRDDDVIIMAGYRIGPFEVESALLGDSRVAEAAVIGVPDELRGEVIEAYVVLLPGVEPSDEVSDELKNRVKTNLAAHAYPRTIHFVDELPKTPSGKIQRFILRKRDN